MGPEVQDLPKIRTSERSQFKRCRQAWWWGYVETLKPYTEAPALRFGTLIHKALEVRYPPGKKRGPHPAATFRALYDSELQEQMAFGFRDDDGSWNDAGTLGEAMMNGFVDKYGKDEEYEVIASEQTFSYRVHNAKTGKPLFDYVGTLDGIWRNRYTRGILMVDWKTAAQISTTHLPLDEQAGAYWTYGPEWMIAQGLLKPDQLPESIMYTFLRKAMPDDRPKNALGQALNKDGSVSKVQPPALFQREIVYRDEGDRRELARRVKLEVREMLMVRAGKLGVYKNPNRFNCGGCGFAGMCELHETQADWQAVRKGTMTTWEPYAAHEIESEGK